jgi:7-carboxy-7-deazaguanine synthase
MNEIKQNRYPRQRRDAMIKINEIFYSIQGESTNAGLPCVFVRLTYCNIRCTYCDTEYAFHEGVDRTIDSIVNEVKSYGCRLVEITGGEPLVQENVHILMTQLCDLGYDVMIETGGSLPIENIDIRVKVIMDIKTPYSEMEKKNRYENIQYLKSIDEIKFVVGSREDYNWAKDIMKKYSLTDIVEQVLFSPVFDKVENLELAEWILKDKLNVRFQLQMHKYIWHPETRGV